MKTPLTTRFFTATFLLSFLLGIGVANADAKTNIIFAVDILRHGDRTPTIEIPNDPYPWPEGLGNLTEAGMLQEYAVGKKWHQRYINSLLPARYSLNALYVRSSDLDRTLMSMQSALLGLYPMATNNSPLPHGYQPIPIHTVAKSEDRLLVTDHNAAEFKQQVQRYVMNAPAWQEKQQAYKSQIATWAKLTGLPMADVFDVMPLADNLMVRHLHQVPMPKGLSDEQAVAIIELGKWAKVTIYQSKEMAQYGSSLLAATLSDYFQTAIKPQNSLKCALFAAHETTIMSLLTLLNYPLSGIPNYASDLNFTLYQKDAGYYVAISLNGRHLSLPQCQQSDCSLQEFVQITAKKD